MRWWVTGVLSVVAVAAVLLEEALAAWLLQQDTVAGLISPQGADLAGIVLVAAFLLLRLLVILGLPAVFVGWACWGLSGVAVRRWLRTGEAQPR